jgi:hypothetical protein
MVGTVLASFCSPACPFARQQFVDALLHFAGGLVREGHAEDVARGDAALDHVRDAKSDDAGLARARAGQDEHRAFDGFHGLALLRVERVQDSTSGAEFKLPQNERKRAKNYFI